MPGNRAGSEDRPAPRLAGQADKAAIDAVIARAYARYAERLDRPPAPVLHDYRPEIAARQVWVVGDPITGVIVLIPRDGDLLIENVAVDPSAQGRGLGRALLEFAERHGAGGGLRQIRLYTNEVMHESLAVYLRLGYREVDRRLGDGYHRIFLAKDLGQHA